MLFQAVLEVRMLCLFVSSINTATDIAGTLYGSWLRYVILASIVISQMGFVSAYTIFVAQSLQVHHSTCT